MYNTGKGMWKYRLMSWSVIVVTAFQMYLIDFAKNYFVS